MVYLQTQCFWQRRSRRCSPSVETGRREPWERGCVFDRRGEGDWGIGGFHCSNGVRSFATLGTRGKLGRVDFRKDFWDCY